MTRPIVLNSIYLFFFFFLIFGESFIIQTLSEFEIVHSFFLLFLFLFFKKYLVHI